MATTASNSPFELTALTAAINVAPFKPYQIGGSGIFAEAGVAQTTAKVERMNGALALVNTAARGAAGQSTSADKRREFVFQIPHLPMLSGIDADEMQNVRLFGTENQPDTVTAARDRLLTKMRASLELTIEAHRIGALKGLILDKDGSTLLDLNAAFGTTQQTQAMGLNVATTVVKQKISAAVSKMQSALGAAAESGRIAFCHSNFYDTLVNHANVEKFWLNTPAAQSLAQIDPTQAVTFHGVTFVRYRGGAGVDIDADTAYLVPQGIPDLFITRFAPANYESTVNTMGLPFYASAEPRDFNKGWDVEAQTNPLNLCTRPDAVIKLTLV